MYYIAKSYGSLLSVTSIHECKYLKYSLHHLPVLCVPKISRRGHQLVILEASANSSSVDRSRSPQTSVPFYYLGFNAYWFIDKVGALLIPGIQCI
jgi:hypothetical protein